MRRTMVVGVLVGAALLGGSPALAAPPEIGSASCEETGGTFSRERGLKSCTTTSSCEVARPPVPLAQPVSNPQQVSHYIGVSQRIDTVQTTTVLSQKGSGEITTRSSDAVIDSRVVGVSCTYKSVQLVYSGGIFGGSPQLITNYYPASYSECISRDLFQTP